MTFLVPAKHPAEYLLSQPSVKQSKLALVIHMLEIVIENGHIPNAFLNRFQGNGGQRLGASTRVRSFAPAAASTPKCKPEQILDLTQLIA